MAEIVYNRGLFLVANGGMSGRDLRMLVILGTTTGADDVDLNTVADLDAVSGVSIHSERIQLANTSVTEDDTNNRANLDADNVVFAAAPAVSALGVVIYVEGANDAARQLVCGSTTGFPLPMDGGLTVAIADWARLVRG